MYYQNNLISTIVVSKLCLKYNVKKIVFSSSSSVYGNNKPPLVETMELMPTISPYGETKAMCERILKDMFKANKDFEISILRYFNPIGAHESGLLNDELDSNANNIMSYILQVANGMREKVFVFGDDYNTIDGTGIRDYIHVVDLAKGHVLALENIKNGCEIYNLGTGNGYSVLQLINEFVKVNNINIPYEIVKRRDGDIEASFANCSKANKYLGFETKYDLTKMCEHSYKVL